MPYDDEGRFVYPVPARKARPKAATAPKKPQRTKSKVEISPPDPDPVELNSTLPIEIVTVTPEPEAPLVIPDVEPVTESELDEPPPIPFRPRKAAINLAGKVSENELALLWNAQKWPENLRLKTSEGQPIEVIYRGRWSGGFGPDFKGAIISTGGELRQGDVELHLQTSGWNAHGHQHDPRYNRVIVQVVLEDDAEAGQTKDGARPALLVLQNCFESDAALIEALEQAKASGTRLGSISESDGPCCERVAEHQPDLEKLLEQIDALGQQRFIEKAERYEADCAAGLEGGPAQVFWAGLLEALGYSQNKAPFRRLAAVLPFAGVMELERAARRRSESFEERVLTLEAALLGAAGLLPGQRRVKKSNAGQMALFSEVESVEPLEDWAAGAYVDELEGRWRWLERQIKAGSSFSPMREQDWTFARVRPPNHPARRIAGLARLIARLPLNNEADLPDWLSGKLIGGQPEEACRQLGKIFQAAMDDAESESGQFWTRRFDFAPRALMVGDNAKGAAVDLIGPDRAADIVVNVALPFLYGFARDRNEHILEEAAMAAYRAHPKLGTNELVENVARQVFSPWLGQPYEVILSGKPVKKLTAGRLIETACRQQGLIYLHQRFCARQDYVACPLSGNP